MAFDKAKLFAPRLPEDDVEISVGTLRVRGLNRAEALVVQGKQSLAAKDLAIITMGVVEPQLSEQEAREWFKAAPGGEIEKVSRKISELSGFLEGQSKEQYKSI